MPPDNTTPPPRAKAITRAEYDTALAEAGSGAADVISRLREDKDGLALAAVNRLRDIAPPAEVLRKTIDAASFALRSREMRAEMLGEAAKARAKAEDVRRLLAGAARGYSGQLTASLEGLLEHLEVQARSLEIGLLMLVHLPDRHSENAVPSIALRLLRDSLFLNRPAQHEPMRMLLSVALGREITTAQVREALRQSNAAKSVAQYRGLVGFGPKK